MYLDETKFAMPEDVVAGLLQRWQPVLTIETVPLIDALNCICAKNCIQ